MQCLFCFVGFFHCCLSRCLLGALFCFCLGCWLVGWVEFGLVFLWVLLYISSGLTSLGTHECVMRVPKTTVPVPMEYLSSLENKHGHMGNSHKEEMLWPPGV